MDWEITMAEEKKKKAADKPKVVKINNEGGDDEVWIYAEDPLVNKAIYTTPGKYKVGDVVEEG